MAKTTVLNSLSEDKQIELSLLVDDIMSRVELYLPPQIIDQQKYNNAVKLVAEAQAKIDAFGEEFSDEKQDAINDIEIGGLLVYNHETNKVAAIDDGTIMRVDTQSLMGLLELLDDAKKEAKKVDEEFAKIDKEKNEAEAKANGQTTAKKLMLGCTIKFTMGSGKAKREFEREVLKISEKTVTVEFDEEYPCTTSLAAPTGKKYIKFQNIVEVIANATEVTPDATTPAAPATTPPAATAPTETPAAETSASVEAPSVSETNEEVA